jgi:6-methylsalicylate decarboxylase
VRIDVHHHMFPPTLVAALEASGVSRVGGEVLATGWTPEQSLAFMDRHEIETAILSVPVPLPAADSEERIALAREVNEFGRQTAGHRPDRFGFFATLPLPDVAAAVAEARRALDELRADGVALLTNHGGVYQGDPLLEPLYEELNERQAVCFVHPTVQWADGRPVDSPLAGVQASVLEFPFETTRAIASLVVSGTPSRFPQIRFLFTHAGGCVSSLAARMVDRRPLVAAYAATDGEVPIGRIEQMLEEAQRAAVQELAGFHYDVALASDEQALSALTGLIPKAQLVLGTDFPIAQEIGARVTLRGVDRFAGFTASDRAAVERLNAGRLFASSAQPGISAGAKPTLAS